MDGDGSSYHPGGMVSPTPDQEYEISSSKSHIFEMGVGRRAAVFQDDGLSTATSLDYHGAPASEPSYRMEVQNVGWDAFKLQSVDVPKRCDKVFLDAVLQISKVVAYFLTFVLIFVAGVVSKLSLTILVSNLINSTTPERHCERSDLSVGNTTIKSSVTTQTDQQEKYVAVIWSVCFCLLAPEILTWLSCFRRVTLRQIQGPRLAMTWVLAFISETAYTIGLMLLLYEVIGSTDLVSGLMVTSACCFIPSLLSPLNRTRSDSFWLSKIVFDLLSILAQLSALIFWLFLEKKIFHWILPIALVLISLRYWENYVTSDSPFRFIRWLSEHRTNIGQAQCKVYLFVSLWKIVIILAWITTWHSLSGATGVNIFDLRNIFTGTTTIDLGGKMVNGTWVERKHRFWFWKPNAVFLWLALISAVCGLIGNICGKYACRIRIHVFSFAVPICLVTPASVSAAVVICESFRGNPCAFDGYLTNLVHIKCPSYDSFWVMLEAQHAWLWFLWMLSQWWICAHVWYKMPERRKTNHLFALPEFGSFPLDVSSTLNRMRSSVEVTHKPSKVGHLVQQSQPQTLRSKQKVKDVTAHLYICSFIDRETEIDVVETLKSIIRMDEEQCARRNALRFLIESDPDYFEFESHIFFDNAFLMDTLRGERILDKQAAQLISAFEEAASAVHDFPVILRSPKKMTTPYGGQLQWQLPGGNFCTVHLKDCNLIRAGDRWSQTMALYYVLGHKIMQMPSEVERKEKFAESSYVLFTSGAVRFKPATVTRLLDILKHGSHIGATTCRLRPIGTGPLVWYQKFEYSMRYWMDRATEHMLGSLLRIRTGFTMFRAAALMDDNVVKKFALIPDNSKEFIQFRLGNEQWLCSLLLKQGYKVEYCAAVDVCIHVPETFSSYLRESQREIPLQMAAMADVVSNYDAILDRNENITIMYIGYLMISLVSAVFAFGTVFLVIVTALVDLFRMNMFLALASNAGPVIIFLSVCIFCSRKSQNTVMKILSVGYGLVMLAVLISAAVQLHTSWLSASPVSIFMLAFLLSTLLPAVFHPQEMWNILFAPVYFIAIPTTYLLTIIHSLSTFHLGNGLREPEEEDLAQQIAKWEKLAEEVQNDPSKKFSNKVPSIDVIEELKKYLPKYFNGKKSVTFACGTLCGIVCCPPSDESVLEGPFGDLIGRELFDLGRQLQVMEQRLRARRLGLQGFRPRVPLPEGLSAPLNVPLGQNWDQISEASANFSVSTVRTTVKSPEEFYEKFGKNAGNDKLTEWLMTLNEPAGPVAIENDHWMEDENLVRADPEVLDPIEFNFWRELISSYLVPLTGTNIGLEEAMVEQMKKIRNKVALGFLMVNSLFVLMVFLLELRREDLFIWIASPFTNGNNGKKPVSIQIEPTGIAFLLFFFVLMLVQFIAMLMHRWGTFSHLLANTELSCCKNKNRVGFDYLRENALQIARELQSLKNAREYDVDTSISTIDFRRKLAVATLDVVFRKRFLAIQKHVDRSMNDDPVPRGSRFPRKDQVRTMDSKKSSSREPVQRPHVVQVFQINRDDSMNSISGQGSMKSTTSF